MSTNYTRVNFNELQGGASATPISAANLNNMDEAIFKLATLSTGRIQAYVTPSGDDMTAEFNNPNKPFGSMDACLSRVPGFVAVHIFIAGLATISQEHFVTSNDIVFYPWNSDIVLDSAIAQYTLAFGAAGKLITYSSTSLVFAINVTYEQKANIVINTGGSLTYVAHTPSGYTGAGTANGIKRTANVTGANHTAPASAPLHVILKGSGLSLNFENTNLKGPEGQYGITDSGVISLGSNSRGPVAPSTVPQPTQIENVLVDGDSLTRMFVGIKAQDFNTSNGKFVKMITNVVSSLPLNPAIVPVTVQVTA